MPSGNGCFVCSSVPVLFSQHREAGIRLLIRQMNGNASGFQKINTPRSAASAFFFISARECWHESAILSLASLPKFSGITRFDL